MPYDQLDRMQLRVLPLCERQNKLAIAADHVSLDDPPTWLSKEGWEAVVATAERMRQARENGAPIMMAFGAHTIKNGLAPVLIRLMEEGWLDHLATNGAGIIHDWEFAYQGESSEDVRGYVAEGQFGIWDETGFNLNLAQAIGAFDGLGYGESVGRLIQADEHVLPYRRVLADALSRAGDGAEQADHAAAAADLLAVMSRFDLESGKEPVPHSWKAFSVQAAAYRLGIAFTGHPMIGHDIIYTHPANHCAAIGRTAQRDFLTFADRVSRLEGGVYLSVGSAVMSPMIFEKSLSMGQNLAMQSGEHIDNHFIMVVDLAESEWDWSEGEPPVDAPEYYLRYCKTFNRMGGEMRYTSADNRDFLLALCQELGVTGDPDLNC